MMKKLNKIKLNDFHEMNEMEMKNVVGGSGSAGDCPSGQIKCSCTSSSGTTTNSCVSSIEECWNAC